MSTENTEKKTSTAMMRTDSSKFVTNHALVQDIIAKLAKTDADAPVSKKDSSIFKTIQHLQNIGDALEVVDKIIYENNTIKVDDVRKINGKLSTLVKELSQVSQLIAALGQDSPEDTITSIENLASQINIKEIKNLHDMTTSEINKHDQQQGQTATKKFTGQFQNLSNSVKAWVSRRDSKLAREEKHEQEKPADLGADKSPKKER